MGVAAIAMLAASAISAGAAIHQGQTEKNYNNYLSAQAQADARAEQGAAQVEADRIRKAAKQQRADAIAAIAAGGVDVNSGTALKIDQRISRDSEEDAYLSILGGKDRATRLNAEGQAYRMQGTQAQNAGYVSAGGTLLSAAGKQYGNWKLAGGGK